MCYRNSILKLSLENPSRKIKCTDGRRTLVGDVVPFEGFSISLSSGVSSIILPPPLPPSPPKILLIILSLQMPLILNTSSAAPTIKRSSTSRRFCGACKSLCTIACFVCGKYDSTLCARCYVRGNSRIGLSNADFQAGRDH